MKKAIPFIILALFIYSCKNRMEQKEFNEAIYTVEVHSDKSETLNWADKLNILKLIPLETSQEALIQRIEKISVSDSTIVIYDGKRDEIFIFDSTGNYRAKCGNRGEGPGEHIRFNDVFFEKESNLIYAHEAVRRSMQIFDLDGNLIKEFHTGKFWFQSFCKVDGDFWIYTGYKDLNPEGYALMRVDKEFENLLSGYFPQKEFFPRVLRTTFFENEQGNYYFISPFSNIVFRLDNEIIDHSEVFRIDFGDKTLPYDQIIQMSFQDEYKNMLIEKKYMGDMADFILCGKNLYFTYSQLSNESREYFVWYDIEQNKTFSYDGFIMDNHNMPLTKPVGSHSNGLIFVISPDDFDDEQLKLFEERYGCQFEVDSNPILLYTTNHINN